MMPQPPIRRRLQSPTWLAGQLGRPHLVVVDASYHLGGIPDARQEYLDRHIPGAVFFDIDAIADRSTDLPHMLPDAPSFSRQAGQLGISDRDTVVVYDSSGLFSAARVWWTFTIFGAHDACILDGGLPAWIDQGLPTEAGEVHREPRTFDATLAADAVASLEDVRQALANRTAQVVDARPAGRFAGRDPEPRQGVRSGHMPGAHNVPYSEIVEQGRLASADRLAEAFARAGVDIDQPVISSCGSGITAALLTLALDTMGKPMGRLYDGSWAEWGSRPGLPIDRD